MSVQRYEFNVFRPELGYDNRPDGMHPDPDGEWVSASDYEKAIALLRELVDPEPCDSREPIVAHYCFTHGCDKPCPHERAKELIG